MGKGQTNKIVIVDANDRVVGYEEKILTHKNPVKLHRAISILIYSKDKSKMLITKRSPLKTTWGGFWSNAVCTHPYPRETYQKAGERRLFEELGIKTPLSETLVFTYEAKMDKIWGEHELDYVFVGYYDGEIKPDPVEVDEYKWVDIKELKKDIKKHPDKYTPWFKMILKML